MSATVETKPQTMDDVREAIQNFKVACCALDFVAAFVAEHGVPRLNATEAAELTDAVNWKFYGASIERLYSALAFGDLEHEAFDV